MIKLTEKAVKEVKHIMEEQKFALDGHFLKVGVKGGGCSGYSYNLDIISEKNDDDELIEFDGVRVIVDPRSNLYLDQVTIDFKDEVMGRGFVFSGDNHKSCGCGSSFSVE
jgi:iron-sulfur cluster assembly protein